MKAYSAASEEDVETTSTRPPASADDDSGEKVERVCPSHTVAAPPRDARRTARRCCSPPIPKYARVSSRAGAVAVPALTLGTDLLRYAIAFAAIFAVGYGGALGLRRFRREPAAAAPASGPTEGVEPGYPEGS